MYVSATFTRTGAVSDCIPPACDLVLVIAVNRVLLFVGANFLNGFTSCRVFFAWVISLRSLIIHVC